MVLEMVEMALSLLRNSNDTTGQTSSGIARSLAEFMSTLSQVVNISMNNHGSSKNGPFSCQGNHFVSDVYFRYSVVACNDVPEVSGVSLVVSGCAVSAPFGVVVRPGAGATVCVVTELVNVETVLARCKATDFSAQLNGISVLNKVDDTIDLVTFEDANCLGCHLGDSLVVCLLSGLVKDSRQGRRAS